VHGQLPDDTLEVGGDADVFGVDVVGEGEARRDGRVSECRAPTRTSVRRQTMTRHFQSSTDETRSPDATPVQLLLQIVSRSVANGYAAVL